MPADIDQILTALRLAGGDTAAIEVKAGAGGLPTTISSSLSALANLPGGGTLVLGLSEVDGFAPVRLADPQVLKQALGAKARAMHPPVQLEISDAMVDGYPVVVAEVRECDPAHKPCRVSSTGRAYMRSYDGDYELSDLETQGFLANRTAPRSDALEVPGTGPADLDSQLLETWRAVLQANGDVLARFQGDDLLRRAGILLSSGHLSVAGLLTFGQYPQQYLPRFTVHVINRVPGVPSQRATATKFINGPIPTMLNDTMDWLRMNVPTSIVSQSDGTVRDEHVFPLEALRELVANALVHRDLGAWAQGTAVEVVLEPGKFVIANPGGLFGITVDRLGREHVTSARNQTLVQLAVNARDPRNLARVVEALSDGLRTVVRLLQEHNLPPVAFYDTGIAFRAVLHARSVQPALPSQFAWPQPNASAIKLPRSGTTMRQVYDLVRDKGPATVEEISSALSLDKTLVRNNLTRLRVAPYQLVRADGGRGRLTTYEAVPE